MSCGVLSFVELDMTRRHFWCHFLRERLHTHKKTELSAENVHMAIFLIMMILLLLVLVLLRVAKNIKADFYAAETVSSQPGKDMKHDNKRH